MISGIPFSILDVALKTSMNGGEPLKLVKTMKLLRIMKLGRVFKLEKVNKSPERRYL